MKKMLLLAVVALAAATLPSEAAARHTLAHRVATLETKLKTTQKQLQALARFTDTCLGWRVAGLASYGDPAGSAGYQFDNDGAGPQAPVFTTALDFADTPGDVDIRVPVVNPQCVATGRLLLRPSAAFQRPARLR